LIGPAIPTLPEFSGYAGTLLGICPLSLREALLEAAMADRLQHIHVSPEDHIGTPGLEEAAYVAGWALSCSAALGVVLLVWQLNI